MEVLRYRHDNRKNGVTLGYPEGDVGRIKTQQAFLKAMVEQLLKSVKMCRKSGSSFRYFRTMWRQT